MATRERVYCPQCGHEFYFSTGPLMGDYQQWGQERNAKAVRNGAGGKAIKKALEEHPNAIVYRSNELFYCVACKEFDDQSRYELRDCRSHELLGVSTHICCRCRGEMQQVDPAKIRCPHCQSFMRKNMICLMD